MVVFVDEVGVFCVVFLVGVFIVLGVLGWMGVVLLIFIDFGWFFLDFLMEVVLFGGLVEVLVNFFFFLVLLDLIDRFLVGFFFLLDLIGVFLGGEFLNFMDLVFFGWCFEFFFIIVSWFLLEFLVDFFFDVGFDCWD